VEQAVLERFSPVMLHSILQALRRFEPDLYAHLCRAYHVDADRILGLFTEVELIGPGQLQPLLGNLRLHQSYHDIVYLAGRNALHTASERQGVRFPRLAHDTSRFQALLKQLFPPFLGLATYSVLVRGELHFVELRDSVFARGVEHSNMVCGFYAGFLAELGSNCVEGAATAAEIRCCATDPEAPSCMIRLNL